MRFTNGSPSPFVIGVGICVVVAVAPLLLSESLISALTATPLQRTISAFVVLVSVGVVSLWAVSRVSLRAASAAKRAQGGES